MRDGDIINNRAWFGFDARDLYWLLNLIPASDDFREDVKNAIKKLEPSDCEVCGIRLIPEDIQRSLCSCCKNTIPYSSTATNKV